MSCLRASLALIGALLPQGTEFENLSKKAGGWPVLAEKIKEMDRARAETFAFAVEALGATVPEGSKVALRILDASDLQGKKIGVHASGFMSTESESARRVRINIHAEFLVNGRDTPLTTLRHEMIHAAMRLDLGASFDSLPGWLREGVAVHATGDVASRLMYFLMDPEILAEPERLVNGLEGPDHSFRDYPEDGLAIEYLISLAGPQGLRRLEQRLRAGTGYRDALAAVGGKDFSEFERGAREYAVAAIRRTVERHKGEVEDYRRILAASADERRKLCERFRKDHPASPFLVPVLYYQAVSSGDDGLPAIEDCLAASRPDVSSGLLGPAKLGRAWLLKKQGRTAEALAGFEDVLTWHVDSAAVPDALYALAITLHESGSDRANRFLRLALDSFPSHKAAPKARRLLGE